MISTFFVIAPSNEENHLENQGGLELEKFSFKYFQNSYATKAAKLWVRVECLPPNNSARTTNGLPSPAPRRGASHYFSTAGSFQVIPRNRCDGLD